jgi:hypothetical protein
LLRRYSQEQNTKISVLAEQLAITGSYPAWTSHHRDGRRDR